MVNKKVCMVTWGHDPLDDRIYFKEALSLKKAYKQVTVLAVGSGKICQVEGIKVLVVEGARFSILTMWRVWLAARGERAHFYHLHEPQLLFLGLFLKALYRVRIIYDIHEHLPEMIRDFSRRPRAVSALLAAVFSLVELLLVRVADAVFVASDLLVSRYAKIARRVVAIYNYPRINMFAGDQAPPLALRRKYGSSQIIMYHGQIGSARDIPMLIRTAKLASRKIQGLKLILLGPIFGDSYRAELLRLIRDEQVSDLVELLEPVPHQQVPDYIALSQVGLVILPLLSVFRESLPVKLFEYMACGVPVVGSKLPAMASIVEGSFCGLLVDPTDVEDIARAVCYLLQHPQEAQAMGRRGMKAIEQKYNWSQMETRLITQYRELQEDPC